MEQSGITEWREYRGLSRRRLSKISGVSPVTLRKAEKDGMASPAVLRKLAKVLNVTPGMLIDGSRGDEFDSPSLRTALGIQAAGARKYLGYSIEEMAAAAGLSTEEVKEIESGSSLKAMKNWPTVMSLIHWEDVPTATRASLIQLDEPLCPSPFATDHHDTPREVHAVEILLVESLAAGGFEEVSEQVLNEKALDQDAHPDLDTIPVLHHLVTGPKSDYRVVRVVGESMYTTLWDGDLVLVDISGRRPISGEIVTARSDEGATIKRYRKTRTGIVLSPDNHQYDFAESENGDFVVTGVVTDLVRRNLRRSEI